MSAETFVNSSSLATPHPISIFLSIRTMFYLLAPQETYYEKAEEVPDLTKSAVNVLLTFVIIEQVVSFLKYGRFSGRINDMVTSVSAGLLSIIPNYFTRKYHYMSYTWIFEHYKIYDLSYDSILTYLVTFLFIDMMYYWFHRMSHEVNFFWASHQTHHSSEDYNLTTALRQSIFQGFYFWIFYLPLAFFVRPSIYMVHSHLNIIFMFWVHTEIVDSIGPLEFIFNTPSHHRVHHGRNPYCLDKNYAGVLIIWDRLFGTFEAEKREEEIAYGLVHPVKSFDPIHLQLFNYKYLFKKWKTTKDLNHRLSIMLKGPAWQPGQPRLGNPETAPKIKYPIIKYDGKILQFMNVYVGVQFSFLAIMFTELGKRIESLPILVFSFGIIFGIYNLTCFGWLFDAKPNCLRYEAARLLALIACCIFLPAEMTSLFFGSSFVYGLYAFICAASLGFVLLLWALNVNFKKEISKKA